MKRLFILLLLCIGTANAGLYPVVSSIDIEPTGSNNQARVYITVTPMDIGSASEEVLQTSLTTYTANLYNNQNGTARPATAWANYGAGGLKPTDTVGAIAMNAYRKAPNTSGMWDAIYLSESHCYGYAVVHDVGPVAYSWASAIHPAGCMITPPAQNWCKITTPSLELNHGSITLKNAEGDIAATDVGVNCTSSMAVSFKLTTDDTYVYLAPSGKAQLSINDKPLGSSINLPAGPSTVTLKDMLTGVNTEGVNSGSAVLVMMPY